MLSRILTSCRVLYIDPSYRVFDADKLFDLSDPVLNRDDQLLPFNRLRENMASKGNTVHTADAIFNKNPVDSQQSQYYSLGLLDNYEKILKEKRANLAAFVIMEPPIVLPSLYQALPKISAVFDRVYLPNISGDGYSLAGVDVNKLHKLYWPIPYDDVIENYWSKTERAKRVVVINGSHRPRGGVREQYSLRIKAMVELTKLKVIDLYGVGWGDRWSRRNLYPAYWLNLPQINSIYKGSCISKYEVLHNYDFCLCFENMSMDGYITEKLFDCLYAGTIPLYMGAPNILDYIPAAAFIDCRKYSTWTEMWNDVISMSEKQISTMREAGREFLRSDSGKKFFHSMENICNFE
jgi:hypothetical protein